MADLSTGNHANIELDAGKTLRVEAETMATVQLIYGGPAGTTTLTAQSQEFGPYGAPAKLRVASISGAVTYQITPGAATTPGAPVDAATMSTALAAADAAGRASFRNAAGAVTYTSVASEAQMLSITVPMRVGDAVNRSDTGTTWRYVGPGVQTLLASWRNEGAGSVTAASVLIAGQAMDAAQEAAMRAAIGAAPALSIVSVTAAGNFDLTEASHDGRRIIAAVPGVVFTRTTAWSTSAVGCFLDVDADGTFTLSTGITIPNGCAASSAAAAGGAVDLACVDGILSSKTPTVVAAPAAGVSVLKIAAVSDLASASTAETIIWEGLLSGLSQGSEVDVPLRLGGTGTGSRTMRIRVGGSAGAIDGTEVHTYIANPSTSIRAALGFAIGAGGASAIGVSGNIVNFGATTAAANPNVAITPGADLRVKVTVQKGTAADVVNVQSGQVRVYP